AEDGIRDYKVTGVQTCALPILIKVNEHHRKLVPESRGAVNLALQHLVEMPRIEQASAIVGDGEFLDFLHRLGVLNGNGRVVTNRSEERRVGKECRYRRGVYR